MDKRAKGDLSFSWKPVWFKARSASLEESIEIEADDLPICSVPIAIRGSGTRLLKNDREVKEEWYRRLIFYTSVAVWFYMDRGRGYTFPEIEKEFSRLSRLSLVLMVRSGSAEPFFDVASKKRAYRKLEARPKYSPIDFNKVVYRRALDCNDCPRGSLDLLIDFERLLTAEDLIELIFFATGSIWKTYPGGSLHGRCPGCGRDSAYAYPGRLTIYCGRKRKCGEAYRLTSFFHDDSRLDDFIHWAFMRSLERAGADIFLK